MALKDITLGQYFPGNTIAHKLDPRTKILLVVLYITALFCAKGVYAARGAVTDLSPSRDNLSFYSIGKTMESAFIRSAE